MIISLKNTPLYDNCTKIYEKEKSLWEKLVEASDTDVDCKKLVEEFSPFREVEAGVGGTKFCEGISFEVMTGAMYEMFWSFHTVSKQLEIMFADVSKEVQDVSGEMLELELSNTINLDAFASNIVDILNENNLAPMITKGADLLPTELTTAVVMSMSSIECLNFMLSAIKAGVEAENK